MGLAEAAAVGWLINVRSPVLGERADFRLADASTVHNAPCQASSAVFWGADASTEVSVKDGTCFARDNWFETFALALFCVEVVVAGVRLAHGIKLADAIAVLMVPIVIFIAVDRRALALTSFRVPVEVVRAVSWAANTAAN